MKKFSALMGATMLAVTAMPAQALTFNLIDTGGAGAGTQAGRGFRAAANYWAKTLTNNSTVNLEVGTSSLGAGILGSTGSNRSDVLVTSVVGGLAATGNSALDAQALASVQAQVNAAGAVNAISNGYRFVGNLGVNTNVTRWDNDNSENNSYIWGNTAVLKAIGLTTGDYYGDDFSNVVDGSINFSTNFAFDYDPTDGIDAGKYDFIGVAIHEIGHALGFVSGVDLLDQYGGPNGPARNSGTFSFDNPGGGLMSTLDLFRFSNDATNVAPGSGPVLDWSVNRPNVIAAGGNAYFSIDGGATQVFGDSRFSTGSYNGDGRQASHWKVPPVACVGFLGIMNPYICSADVEEVTALDLASFDAMGYNLNVDILNNPNYTYSSAQAFAAIPEPAQWAMMLGGFGLLGGAVRRRKASVRVTFA